MERYLQIITISLEAVLNNKFRSILTALGIIFGVGAVIAMMAIGNGARQEILEMLHALGEHLPPDIKIDMKTFRS